QRSRARNDGRGRGREARARGVGEKRGRAFSVAAFRRARTRLIDNGDFDFCWRHHTAREHQRLYPAPDQQEYGLTA
ncbi:hypothetical protein, partial [Streptomyces sp. NPDC088360]|uniref:hypothetical protein n=1 Tax=Streptomyces sp. NPDC088360 TaxID=3154515 RepID=UPI00344DCED6